MTIREPEDVLYNQKKGANILSILETVGDTPLVRIKMDGFENISLCAKLESYNPTGSVKDRAASYILSRLLHDGTINADTTIIESTSGNFGVSLSAFCKYYGLKFIAVVDPHITAMNEMLIQAHDAQIIKVTEPDAHGGYLLNRIKKIKELQATISNCYWVNQYENPLNARAYYHSLGTELCVQLAGIDYVFLGVSSGGTITGVSQKVKEHFPNAIVVAVDVEGSLIFGKTSGKRFIPGIGSSMVPAILKEAFIDEVVIADETSAIRECHELLAKHTLFVGGSSGSVLSGIKKYFRNRESERALNVVTVFPDKGERYYDTIFNSAWCEEVQSQKKILADDQVSTL
jgi:N-(2-amino-2-carboxyethyl)-L-glutamate synthase